MQDHLRIQKLNFWLAKYINSRKIHFWTVFLSFILSISSIGCLALILKWYFSYRANLHRVQTIHISLEDQNQILNNDNIVHCHNFNNQSYNSSLLSCREIIALFTIPIFYIIIMLLPVFCKFWERRSSSKHLLCWSYHWIYCWNCHTLLCTDEKKWYTHIFSE